MRALRLVLLSLLLGACGLPPAGSTPSGGPGTLENDRWPAPGCVLDDAAEPVAVHPFDPAVTDGWVPSFGPCGHLLVHERLAAPDLASLEPFPGDATGFARFSPTGEWLAVDDGSAGGGRSRLVDLRTGGVSELLGVGGATVFAPRRAGDGSYVVRCGSEGLTAFDGLGTRGVVGGPVACDDRLVAAAAAPVVVFAGAGDRLHVADLERSTLLELPFDAPGPPTPGGSNVGRNDLVHVSPDGTLLLYQRVDEVLDRGYYDDRPEGHVSLVDLQTGETLGTYPASETWPVEPVDVPGRGHGLLWATEGHTYEVEPDLSVRDFPVELGRLAWAGPTGAIGNRWIGLEDAGWVRLDFRQGTWTPLDPEVGEPVVSASGRVVAGQLLARDALWSRVSVEGEEPRDVYGLVPWVGDDGAALVIEGSRLVLLGPDGVERSSAQLGQPGWRADVRAVPGALVALVGGELFVVDVGGGTPRVLARDVTDFRIDPAGRRIAYQVERSPGDIVSDLVLYAGRLDP